MGAAGLERGDESPAPKQRQALLRYRRSRETRERLALEATKLWREKGFEVVTVDDICARAGVSRSTYYFHFPNKEALLGELDLMTARRVGVELNERAEAAGASLNGDIDIFIEGLVRRSSRLPRELFARAMLGAMQGLAFVGQLEDEEADFGRSLADSFRRAQSRHELGEAEDAAELAAVFASMVMEGLLRWAHGTTLETDLELVLRRRAAIFFEGVRGDRLG